MKNIEEYYDFVSWKILSFFDSSLIFLTFDEKFVKKEEKINRKVFFILSKIWNCLKYERICGETIERCIQGQKFIY